jgi:hypothetical protein
MTTITTAILNIQGAPLNGENPLPIFRDGRHDAAIDCIEPFPEEKKNGFGYENGFRILPYRFQNRFGRKHIPLQFKSVELENSRLKAVFLPELGGRLISLFDKEAGRELLSRNPVFQPGNLAIRKAWFSGGIEWNIGQLGHAFHTCSPVFAAIVKAEGGEPFLRIYEFERCKCLFWQVDFHLPENSPVLYAYTRVINPNAEAVPMYWWTNIAVPETPGARVFASAEEVIYVDPMGIVSGIKGYGYAQMPFLPSLPGKDSSYPAQSDFANEYFFQCPPVKMPWEAMAYEDGQLFFEASTERLRYRKMFCWGNHSGGKRWQEFLSEKGVAYVEIQAGLAPTQCHGLDMPAAAVWDWTQAFGGKWVDPGQVCRSDWNEARRNIGKEIQKTVPENELYSREAIFKRDADREPLAILHAGAGWGALELERMRAAGEEKVLKGLSFPFHTIGEEQYPWLALLQNGAMPKKSPEQLPGAWMVQKEWKRLLLSSLDREEGCHWYALLHAGVMACEDGAAEEAEAYWKASLEKRESVWAYRNMTFLEKLAGNRAKAAAYMRKAMGMPGASEDQALAEEFLLLLVEEEEYSEAWETFEKLPAAVRAGERMELTAGRAAIELGQYEFVEKLFNRDFACIREGETTLTDLWFKYTALKWAEENGLEYTPSLLDQVIKTRKPPLRLDFRTAVKY